MKFKKKRRENKKHDKEEKSKEKKKRRIKVFFYFRFSVSFFQQVFVNPRANNNKKRFIVLIRGLMLHLSDSSRPRDTGETQETH